MTLKFAASFKHSDKKYVPETVASVGRRPFSDALKTVCERLAVKSVKCPSCGAKTKRGGKTSAGSLDVQ